MPQDAWVLKCYSCKKFQVQLKKKAKKWQCKVCGAKQDVITIFYKGAPSDCRVNVQQMNAAEGEALEKLQELSTYQNESYDEFENYKENSQDQEVSYNYEAEFAEDIIAEIDKQCNDIEQTYSQEIFEINSVETIKNNSIQNLIRCGIQNSEVDELDESDQKKVLSTSYFDVTSKRYMNNVSENEIQVKKSNIFESNGDFDESLDF